MGVWAGHDIRVDGGLAEADLAVYRAKASGRDRWEMAEDVGDAGLWEPEAPQPRRLRGLRRVLRGRALR